MESLCHPGTISMNLLNNEITSVKYSDLGFELKCPRIHNQRNRPLEEGGTITASNMEGGWAEMGIVLSEEVFTIAFRFDSLHCVL